MKGRFKEACNVAKMQPHQNRYIFSTVFAIFGTFLQPYLNPDSHLFLLFFILDPFPAVSRRFLSRSDKCIACPHESLWGFWPRTAMVIDQGCCGRSHLFSLLPPLLVAADDIVAF